MGEDTSLWHVPDGKCLWERLVTVPAVHTAALPVALCTQAHPSDRRTEAPSTPEMWQCHTDRPDYLATEMTPQRGHGGRPGCP